MSRQAVDFDARNAAFDRETIKCFDDCLIVRAAFDVDVIKCTDVWMWCQNCCIWSWNGQMHADGCLLMKLSGLHLMPMSSDALTIVSMSDCVAFGPTAIRWQTIDAQIAAFNRDEVKCTDDCLIVRLLHLTVKQSNARWRLFDCLLLNWKADKLLTDDASKASKMKSMCCIWCRCHQMQWRLSEIRTAAPDAEIIECTDEIVWLSGCCIRPWNDQMRAGGCLYQGKAPFFEESLFFENLLSLIKKGESSFLMEEIYYIIFRSIVKNINQSSFHISEKFFVFKHRIFCRILTIW